MTRVKRGTISAKTRRYTLKAAKGYRFGRSKKEKMAFVALTHAGKHSFAHRRDKKSNFRRDWQVVIGAAVRPEGLSYSKFINGLKKKNITLDRKILATLAKDAPATFSKVVAAVK
jgi:large subunit ribosomal protein L20